MARLGTTANAAIIRGHEGVDEVVVEVVQGVVGDEHGVEALRPLHSSKDAPEVVANEAPFPGAFPKLGSLRRKDGRNCRSRCCSGNRSRWRPNCLD